MIGLQEAVLLAATIALQVWTLLKIRSSGLGGTEAVLWVIVILCIPLLGAGAFLIVRPDSKVSH